MDEGRDQNVAERVGDHAFQDRGVEDHHRAGDAGHAHGHEREELAPGHVLEIGLDDERRLHHAEKDRGRGAEAERAADVHGFLEQEGKALHDRGK